MAIEMDVRRFMRALLNDPASEAWDEGAVNYTALAEAAAIRFHHDDWLDDETHWVWQTAIEEGEPYDP